MTDTATVQSHALHDSPAAFDAAVERAQQELLARLGGLTGIVEGGVETAVPGLYVYRVQHSSCTRHSIQVPSFSMIAQGSKRLLVGEEIYEYDPMHCLVTSVDLPVVATVAVASPSRPYLGLRLDFSVEDITELIHDERMPPAAPAGPSRGLYVQPVGATLLDAVLRLLRLLDAPADIPILAPLVRREILYRLLVNGQGAPLRQVAMQDSQAQRVAKAIRLLRENYAQPLRVEAIARDVHMSVSSLHHHFKAVTAMSPLQYQKQLRLQEARRLLFLGSADIAMAAHQVGYESASQFSREYSRLFGASPLKDRRRWQEETGRGD
jgi:AraC-like DNA-binding protein